MAEKQESGKENNSTAVIVSLVPTLTWAPVICTSEPVVSSAVIGNKSPTGAIPCQNGPLAEVKNGRNASFMFESKPAEISPLINQGSARIELSECGKNLADLDAATRLEDDGSVHNEKLCLCNQDIGSNDGLSTNIDLEKSDSLCGINLEVDTVETQNNGEKQVDPFAISNPMNISIEDNNLSPSANEKSVISTLSGAQQNSLNSNFRLSSHESYETCCKLKTSSEFDPSETEKYNVDVTEREINFVQEEISENIIRFKDHEKSAPSYNMEYEINGKPDKLNKCSPGEVKECDNKNLEDKLGNIDEDTSGNIKLKDSEICAFSDHTIDKGNAKSSKLEISIHSEIKECDDRVSDSELSNFQNETSEDIRKIKQSKTYVSGGDTRHKGDRKSSKLKKKISHSKIKNSDLRNLGSKLDNIQEETVDSLIKSKENQTVDKILQDKNEPTEYIAKEIISECYESNNSPDSCKDENEQEKRMKESQREEEELGEKRGELKIEKEYYSNISDEHEGEENLCQSNLIPQNKENEDNRKLCEDGGSEEGESSDDLTIDGEGEKEEKKIEKEQGDCFTEQRTKLHQSEPIEKKHSSATVLKINSKHYGLPSGAEGPTRINPEPHKVLCKCDCDKCINNHQYSMENSYHETKCDRCCYLQESGAEISASHASDGNTQRFKNTLQMDDSEISLEHVPDENVQQPLSSNANFKDSQIAILNKDGVQYVAQKKAAKNAVSYQYLPNVPALILTSQDEEYEETCFGYYQSDESSGSDSVEDDSYADGPLTPDPPPIMKKSQVFDQRSLYAPSDPNALSPSQGTKSSEALLPSPDPDSPTYYVLPGSSTDLWEPSRVMADSDVIPLVIDHGSGTIKAGFAGDDAPRSVFTSVVGQAQKQDTNKRIEELDTYIGDQPQSLREMLSLCYPIEQGIITHWDQMEKIWLYTFCKELRVSPEEHPVLLTEPPLNPANNREKMTQIMFETFNVPGLHISVQAMLSLFASGRLTGAVLDSGAGVTHAVPICDGHVLPKAVGKPEVSGTDLTTYLRTLLNEKGHGFSNTYEDRRTVGDIKEKLCYVAGDDVEINTSNGNGKCEKKYKLPDGKVLMLSDECYKCPEAMFEPSLLGFNTPGVDECLHQSINKCDLDLQCHLYSNIVLSGGSTMFPGMSERLTSRLFTKVPKTYKVKVVAPPERKYSVWIGGSILASLSSFEKKWITSEEYEEYGPNIVQKKCF